MVVAVAMMKDPVVMHLCTVEKDHPLAVFDITMDLTVASVLRYDFVT